MPTENKFWSRSSAKLTMKANKEVERQERNLPTWATWVVISIESTPLNCCSAETSLDSQRESTILLIIMMSHEMRCVEIWRIWRKVRHRASIDAENFVTSEIHFEVDADNQLTANYPYALVGKMICPYSCLIRRKIGGYHHTSTSSSATKCRRNYRLLFVTEFRTWKESHYPTRQSPICLLKSDNSPRRDISFARLGSYG